MAGEDLLRPVELLQQHAADEEMRPGHHTQRQHRVGALDNGGPEPLGTADREGYGADTAVAPGPEPVGQFTARPFGATLVERDETGAGGQRGEGQLGLARLQLWWRKPTLFFQLDDRRGRHDATGIIRLQVIERPVPEPADGEDVEA